VVEPSPIGRAHCQRNGVTAYPNLESLPANHTYAVVSLIHVVEHVGFPVETLKALSGFLSHDGGIYVEVPNLRSLRARIFPFIRKYSPNDCWFRAFPSHLHGFCRRSLDKTIREAGFIPVGWSTYGGGFEVRSRKACVGIHSGESFLPSVAPVVGQSFVVSRLKSWMKRLLFGSLLLGENLCVYCVPHSAVPGNEVRP